MEIKEIRLRNFRNHHNLQLKFSTGLNIIIGPNGSGKSNIVEAIVLLATTKSYRTTEITNLIEDGQEFTFVEGDVSDKKLKIVISAKGRQCYCDRSTIRLSSDFIGLFQAIVFSPKDLLFVSDPPKVRRRFIDSELSKINRNYLRKLSEYNIRIKNRNAILKSENVNIALLDVLDETLAELMVDIAAWRKEYLSEINKKFTDKLNLLVSEPAKAEISCQTVCEGLNKEDIQRQLQNQRTRDILSKKTNFGTHRDDYLIRFNGHEAESYCSQGYTRLIMLALKLVLADICYELTGEKPVILLDDVLSELDLIHQKKLLSLLPKEQQTIITATHLDDVLAEANKNIIELTRRN